MSYLFQLPHDNQVALKFLHAPKGGDAQFSVLHLNLHFSISSFTPLLRHFMSAKEENVGHLILNCIVFRDKIRFQ